MNEGSSSSLIYLIRILYCLFGHRSERITIIRSGKTSSQKFRRAFCSLLDHAINLQYRTVDIDYVSYVSFASIYYNCSTICHSYTCKAKVTFALKYAFPTRLLRCKLRERRNCFWFLFLKYLIYIKVCLGKSSPHEWRESLVIRLRTVVLSYHRHVIWPPTINKIIAWCWWLGYR